MDENHQREQYFWDDATLERMIALLDGYSSPCCLCTPTLGRALAERGRTVRVLDIDERFADLPGFRRFDLWRPDYLEEQFDLILCDPPFFTVKLSDLFTAIRQLAHFQLDTPVAVSWLHRREDALLGTFAPFGLGPTRMKLGYRTVPDTPKNDIRLYANVPLG